MERRSWHILIILLVSSLAPGLAQESPPAATPPGAPPIRSVGPGLFELGPVTLDKNRKAVTFPAFISMHEGVIEYLLVTTGGKTHESLLRTDVQPYHIHLALLLLGAKGAQTNVYPEDQTLPIPGDRLSVTVTWTAKGKEKSRPAEHLVLNRRTRTPASPGPWTHNGSRTVAGIFLAQRDGSIVSLITDGDALINNPRPGREDDEHWEINQAELPPINTPVQVTLKLDPDKPKP